MNLYSENIERTKKNEIYYIQTKFNETQCHHNPMILLHQFWIVIFNRIEPESNTFKAYTDTFSDSILFSLFFCIRICLLVFRGNSIAWVSKCQKSNSISNWIFHAFIFNNSMHFYLHPQNFQTFCNENIRNIMVSLWYKEGNVFSMTTIMCEYCCKETISIIFLQNSPQEVSSIWNGFFYILIELL